MKSTVDPGIYLTRTMRVQLEGNFLTGAIPAPVVLMTQHQLTSFSFKGNPSLSLPADIGAVTVLTVGGALPKSFTIPPSPP
jgi:hypothetical protein